MADKIDSKSPLQQETDLVSVSVMINGQETPGTFELSEVEVRKELNKIPTARVVFADGDPSASDFPASKEDIGKPGNEIKITAGYHQKEETIFEGIIVGHGIRVKSAEISELVLKCTDKSASMTVERKNRYFPESTDSDVMTKVCGDHSISATIASTSFAHEEMVQYWSTDWDFLVTRAEINGFVVVVGDNKLEVKAPETSNDVVSLTYGNEITKLDLEIDSRYQLPAVKAEGWDMSTNKLVDATAAEPAIAKQGNITGKKDSEVLASTEYKLQATGPIDKSMLQAWADAKLLRSRLSHIRGKIRFPGTAAAIPDTTISLSGLGPRFIGSAYVSGVFHHIKDGTWETEATVGMPPQMFSETQRDIAMPPASGMLPSVSGLQIGTVQKIDEDPEGETRILVDVPMITASGDGIWARQTTYYATKEAGNFFIPEVGDEVVLGFLNDDPRYAIIIGSVYSKTQMPPYTPDAENTYKAIVTNSKMKIEFEDVKRICTIWTPNNNTMIFSDDEGSITIEDENSNKIVMDSAGINIYTPKDLVVKADGNISMEAGSNFDMKAGANLAAEAGANADVKAGASLTAEGSASATLKAGGTTTVKGATVMIN